MFIASSKNRRRFYHIVKVEKVTRAKDEFGNSCNATKNRKIYSPSKVVLLHQGLGHPSSKVLKHNELVSGKVFECETCFEVSMEGEEVVDYKQNDDVLGQVSVDCVGPIKADFYSHYGFLLCTDQGSQYRWVYTSN